MKGFIIFSWVTGVTVLFCLPFAYLDWGWFGIGVCVLSGAMPFGSAIAGAYYWKHGLLDNKEIQRKLLFR